MLHLKKSKQTEANASKSETTWDTGSNSKSKALEPFGLVDGLKHQWNKIWPTKRVVDSSVFEDSGMTKEHLHVDSEVDNGWLSYVTTRALWSSTPKSSEKEQGSELIRPTDLYMSNTTANCPTAARRSLSFPGYDHDLECRANRRSASQSTLTEHMIKGKKIRIIRNGAFHTQEQRTAEQAKDFCRDYISLKLKCNNLLNRVKITRSPSCDHWVMREIYVIGGELEWRNQMQCKNLSKQIGITLRSEEVLRKVFFEFASEIITTDINSVQENHCCVEEDIGLENKHSVQKRRLTEITWGRIIAIFVVAGALAIDCVTQGHSELVNELIEYCGEFFSGKGVVEWIICEGGWERLPEVNLSKPEETETASTWNIVIISVCVFSILALGMGISNLTALRV